MHVIAKGLIFSLGVVALTVGPASAGLIVNGDFSNGLDGWQTFTTSSGTLGAPATTSFDTDGDGVSDPAARFAVGRSSGLFGDYQGGGISQVFNLASAGDLMISADIATASPTLLGHLAGGGFFQLFLDGALVDSHGFGFIDLFETERHTLSGTLSGVAAGSHTLTILMRRPIIAEEGVTAYQYVDNVSVETDFSSMPAPIPNPEPGTMILAISGALGLGLSRVRRTFKKRS